MRAVVTALAAIVIVVTFTTRPDAETTLCTNSGFPLASGAQACSGASSAVTVSATVRTYARLTLEQIFGSPAAGLAFALGEIDASCIGAPAPGVSCLADHVAGAATWFGDVRFGVKLAGIGTATARLVGVRPSTGTIPAGRLLDGAAGAAPGVSYPVAPASPTALRSLIGAGDTSIARSIGLRVLGTDPPGAWSGTTVFSLVLE